MGSEKAINALKWCVKEMDRRYDIMSKAGYNNIEPYNKSDLVKAGQFEHFPYIVIIVDELAEIMNANKKEAEVCIQRITQLARACGMHLVLATQRPSVDIVTGVIKANVPSRIAFNVQSSIDSKIIINTVGAEKLLGQGDMLFAPTGTSVISRLQAAYATDSEIASVIDYDKKYNSSNYDESVQKSFDEQDIPVDDAGSNGETVFIDAPSKDKVDEYFKTAIKMVMMQGFASISYLQRRLSIGYSRAAKIIDQMEDRGYIAPATGAKQRKVLITPEQFREAFGEDFNTL
jgi:S-DNA-T family DNA segregation ATPase FtsK/SpoIIIE